MRFITLAVAALIGNVSASNIRANQLTSLKSMVRNTGEWDANTMILTISDRKVQLERALDNGSMSKQEVADELKFLLELVKDVESNDQLHAVHTLTTRKMDLTQLTDTVTYEVTCNDESTPTCPSGSELVTPTAAEEDPLCDDDSTPTCADDSTPVVSEVETTPTTDPVTYEVTCNDDSTPTCPSGSELVTPTAADEDPLCDDDSTPTCEDGSAPEVSEVETTTGGDSEDDGTEEEKGSGMMIGIVAAVAAVAVIGGCVCYRQK